MASGRAGGTYSGLWLAVLKRATEISSQPPETSHATWTLTPGDPAAYMGFHGTTCSRTG